MREFWFCALALSFTAWAVLDGYDFGVGILHRVLTRTDEQRRTALAAIGPFWDGNEVWLLAAGGTLFVAFPPVLGAALSGLYLPVIFLIWALLGRGLSLELRGHVDDPLWKEFFDFAFQISSGLVALLAGVAFAVVLRGVPLDESRTFASPLWGEGGVIDGWTLLVGLTVVAGLTAHGMFFLRWKTAIPVAPVRWAAGFVVLWLLSLLTSPLLSRIPERPVAWGFLAGCVAAGLVAWRGGERVAFLGSSAFLACSLGASFACVFPDLLRSTLKPEWSLTVANTASPDASLVTAATWWIPGVLLVGGYFVYVLRTFRGKATP